MSVGEIQVSILMLTFNHASYLREAIASVQSQSLSAWELLIGEDCSSDGTALIAAEAASADPRIQIFSSPGGSLGFHRNFARLLAASRAPYVAFLEGDDWWCDPCKLECQLALLNEDSSLAFCGGRTRVIDQRSGDTLISSSTNIGPSPSRRRLSLPDLIGAYSFHFSSVLMRRNVVQLPSWIFHQYCLDRPLYLLAACHGDAGVIDRELSVYRLHGGGVWAPLSPLQKARRSYTLFQSFVLHFPRCHRRHFRLALSHILWSYLAEALQRRDRLQSLLILVMGVQAAPVLRLIRDYRLTLGALRRSFLF